MGSQSRYKKHRAKFGSISPASKKRRKATLEKRTSIPDKTQVRVAKVID